LRLGGVTYRRFRLGIQDLATTKQQSESGDADAGRREPRSSKHIQGDSFGRNYLIYKTPEACRENGSNRSRKSQEDFSRPGVSGYSEKMRLGNLRY
jgi:hypothetical protein